jgi:hypothetical protein
MNEKKALWSGWLVATGALLLAAVLAISGAQRAQARVPEMSKASVPSASIEPGEAHAESDTCDLQLD